MWKRLNLLQKKIVWTTPKFPPGLFHGTVVLFHACGIGNRCDAEATVLNATPDVLEELSTEGGSVARDVIR